MTLVNMLACVEMLSLTALIDFYESNYNNNVSFGSGSFNVSGSGTYGMFRTTLDNDIHFGTWFLNSQNLFQSDAINLSIDTTNSGYTASDMRFRSYVTNTNVLAFNILAPSGSSGEYTIYDSSGYMARNRSTSGYTYYVATLNVNNAIPIIPSGASIDVYSAYGAMTKGAPMLSLPSATVSDETPWAYYNSVLLPYIRQNYNIDNIDNYLWFPNGYTPAVTPDIFSPSVNFGGVGVGGLGGIIAGAGAIINVGGVGTVNVFAPIQGQIRIDGVQLQFPVDLPDSVYVNRNQVSIPTVDPIEIAGHVLDMISNTHFTFDGVDFTINADGTISISGTPYTLPIGTPTQPDTTPYEYMYEVPTMERIELIEPTIEPVGLSSFKDGITGLYGLGARLYYDLGLFRPLLICLGIAGVGYAISRIGGH